MSGSWGSYLVGGVVSASTIFPTRLVSAGDGSMLVWNDSYDTVVYLSDSSGVATGDGDGAPLTPQSFVVVDGTEDVWGTTAYGTEALVSVMPGGTAAGNLNLATTILLAGQSTTAAVEAASALAHTDAEAIVAAIGSAPTISVVTFTPVSGPLPSPENPSITYVLAGQVGTVATLDSQENFGASTFQYTVLPVVPVLTPPAPGTATAGLLTYDAGVGSSTATAVPAPSSIAEPGGASAAIFLNLVNAGIYSANIWDVPFIFNDGVTYPTADTYGSYVGQVAGAQYARLAAYYQGAGPALIAAAASSTPMYLILGVPDSGTATADWEATTTLDITKLTYDLSWT